MTCKCDNEGFILSIVSDYNTEPDPWWNRLTNYRAEIRLAGNVIYTHPVPDGTDENDEYEIQEVWEAFASKLQALLSTSE